MSKVVNFIGKIFIGLSIIFLLLFLFTSISDGSTMTDMFGLTIPEPPVWTSFIPVLGYLLVIILQIFSLHGLVGAIVFIVLLSLGLLLQKISKKIKKSGQTIKQQVENCIDNLDPKHFPKLIEWRKANRVGLVEQILRDKQRAPKDSIAMIAASYESDLQHG